MSRAGRALDALLLVVEVAGALVALGVVIAWFTPLDAPSWAPEVIAWGLAAGWMRTGRKYDRLEVEHRNLATKYAKVLTEKAALKAAAKVIARGRHL